MADPNLVSGLSLPDQLAQLAANRPGLGVSPDLLVPPAQLPPDDPRALAKTFVGQQQLKAPDWFNPIGTKIRQAEGTAGGSGQVFYGGAPIPNPGKDFPDWPGATGPTGQHTSAAGPFQWEEGSWRIEVKRAKAQGVDLDFSNPQHQNWAAYDLASRTYKDHTGRSLEEDQKSGNVNLAAMSSEWQGLGSRDPAGVHRELQTNMFGGFNSDARQFTGALVQSMQANEQRYDAAMRRAEKIEDFAIAQQGKLMAQATQPPQNMHQAWGQWGGAASLLALLGGIAGGRHFTAALGAAGSMMTAANDSDRGAYDKAYAAWKDQRDFGMRATELLLREADSAISRAGNDYAHQNAALQALSSAYQLPAHLDHEKLADMAQKLSIEKSMADITKAQNADTEERLAVDEKNAKWSAQNGGAPVPAQINNQHVGEVKRERAGTIGTPQLLTDPSTGTQFTMVPGHPETAQTLSGQPYSPSGAQKVGTGSQATPSPQTVASVAQAVAGYRQAPPSGYALRSAWGQQVMGKVYDLNPDYDQSKWTAKVRGEVAFTAGKEGGAIRSFSVSIDHLNTMEEAGEALANTDVTALNRLKNRMATEFGYEGPVDFNFVKSIVGSEVSKAIVGGVGALTDREELRVNLDAANSPEQLLGVISFAKKLMAGQLSGYRLQAKNFGMSDEEFDKHLSPAAKQELGGLPPRATSSQPQTGDAPLPPTFQSDPEGTVYRQRGSRGQASKWVKQSGDLVQMEGASASLGLPRAGEIGRALLGGAPQWEVMSRPKPRDPDEWSAPLPPKQP